MLVLVGVLARRLGMEPRGAVVAGGLHLTAYPGFHAYLWSIGVQHVITVLFVLALFTTYLTAEHRRRAGHAYRGWYAAAVAAAVLSSLCRTSSLIGPRRSSPTSS